MFDFNEDEKKGFPFGNDAADAEPKEGTVVESASDDDNASLSSFLDMLVRKQGLLADNDDDDDDDDDDDEDGLNADEVHNKAVHYSRSGKPRTAMEICMKGLERFPNNADLLADTVKYASECGDMAEAQKHYELLKTRLPVTSWNWRAFTFSFDYLMGDPITNEKECRKVVESYERVLPYEQRAYLAECELEEALGNAEGAMTVLHGAVHKLANAAQCALKLADMQLDRGQYNEAHKTALYGIAAAESQPSINAPYLLYVCALARDHELHEKVMNGEPVTQDEVDALEHQYSILGNDFPELIQYRSNIKRRARMLQLVEVQ